MNPYVLASNGVVHRTGCEHAHRLKVLFDAPTIKEAKDWGQVDFENKRITVAPCAKRVMPSF